MRFDLEAKVLRGEHGQMPVPPNDEMTRKLAMLIEGECEGVGPTNGASKAFSRPPIAKRSMPSRAIFPNDGTSKSS